MGHGTTPQPTAPHVFPSSSWFLQGCQVKSNRLSVEKEQMGMWLESRVAEGGLRGDTSLWWCPRGSPDLCSHPLPHCPLWLYWFFSSSLSLTSVSLLQIGTQNSLEILEDPKAEVVDEIAAKLGLRKVRMWQVLCVRVWQGSGQQFSPTPWGYPRPSRFPKSC